jgi:AraC-like DNA-binding protein
VENRVIYWTNVTTTPVFRPSISAAQHPPLAEIAAAIARFRRRGRIEKVYFAQQAATPPKPLAYLVHFPRLSVTLAGQDAMWLEQDGHARLVQLREGDAVVVPPDHWNRPAWNHASVTLNFLFGHRQVGLSLVRCDGRSPAPPAALKTTLPALWDDALRSSMQALLALPATGTASTAPWLVEALLSACGEAARAPAPPTQRRAAALYDSICMYVQEHFQFALTRESVAGFFRISPTHVSRLFSREGSVAFNDYVNYVRINRAKHLLKHYHQTLDEVAAACGFNDASYFCRMFKRKTKLNPTAYRQQSARPPADQA